jgi:hypothetical protein
MKVRDESCYLIEAAGSFKLTSRELLELRCKLRFQNKVQTLQQLLQTSVYINMLLR